MSPPLGQQPNGDARKARRTKREQRNKNQCSSFLKNLNGLRERGQKRKLIQGPFYKAEWKAKATVWNSLKPKEMIVGRLSQIIGNALVFGSGYLQKSYLQ